MCEAVLPKLELVRSINNSYWLEGESELRKGEKQIICVYDYNWHESQPRWQFFLFRK